MSDRERLDTGRLDGGTTTVLATIEARHRQRIEATLARGIERLAAAEGQVAPRCPECDTGPLDVSAHCERCGWDTVMYGPVVDAEFARLRAEVERLTGLLRDTAAALGMPGSYEGAADIAAVPFAARDAVAEADTEANELEAEVARLTAALAAPLVRLRPGQVAVSEWAEVAPGVALAHAWRPSGPLPTLQAGPTSWSVGWRGGDADSLPAAQAAAETAVVALARTP